MKTNQMIEENNQLRRRLNHDNRVYYEDLLLYVRFKSFAKNEAQIESFLLDVLQDLVAAQKDGRSAIDYFGKSPKDVADAFLAEVPQNFWEMVKLTGIVIGSYAMSTILPSLTTTGKPIDLGVMLIAGMYALVMILLLFKYLADTIYHVSTWRLHKGLEWAMLWLLAVVALAPMFLIHLWVKTPLRVSLDGIWGIGVILLVWVIGGIIYLRLTDKRLWLPFVVVALLFGMMGIMARIPQFAPLLNIKLGRYLYVGLMIIGMIAFYILTYLATKKLKKSAS
ncbi:hypothetical protein [Leuconostoc holzapfelii]|uniref:DUF1129 domain-containing protein n=1 Tax=Leuconostoc holzapfelii TaxID=434464 RepID=A0A846ZE81_9LACO|nr:hypothetical protein [Leuconostoc holzapfelii]NKZ18364.1 hypothetical protein [Leuconostoc holzapfelii]